MHTEEQREKNATECGFSRNKLSYFHWETFRVQIFEATVRKKRNGDKGAVVT